MLNRSLISARDRRWCYWTRCAAAVLGLLVCVLAAAARADHDIVDGAQGARDGGGQLEAPVSAASAERRRARGEGGRRLKRGKKAKGATAKKLGETLSRMQAAARRLLKKQTLGHPPPATAKQEQGQGQLAQSTSEKKSNADLKGVAVSLRLDFEHGFCKDTVGEPVPPQYTFPLLNWSWAVPDRDVVARCSGTKDACDEHGRRRAAAHAYLLEGQAQWAAGRVSIAKNYWQAAVELVPGHAVAWTALGNCWAIEFVGPCFNTDARMGLACAGANELPSAALAHYARAAQLFPSRESQVLKDQVKRLVSFMEKVLPAKTITYETNIARRMGQHFASLTEFNMSSWPSSIQLDGGVVKRAPEQLPVSEGMKLLFGTPLSHVSVVQAFGGAARFKEMTDPIAKEVMRAYTAFRDSKGDDGAEADAPAAWSRQRGGAVYDGCNVTLNNAFFSEQQRVIASKQGWRELDQLRGFRELQAFTLSSFDEYFAAILGGGSAVRAKAKDVQWWLSVHHGGSAHQPHVHHHTAAVGVFYLRAPADGGSITFYDPRGGNAWEESGLLEDLAGEHGEASQDVEPPLPGSTHTPPFHRTYKVQPAAGDLVVFAPYLKHGVQAGFNSLSTPRISLSFNLIGNPHETTSLGAETVPGAATGRAPSAKSEAPAAQSAGTEPPYSSRAGQLQRLKLAEERAARAALDWYLKLQGRAPVPVCSWLAPLLAGVLAVPWQLVPCQGVWRCNPGSGGLVVGAALGAALPLLVGGLLDTSTQQAEGTSTKTVATVAQAARGVETPRAAPCSTYANRGGQCMHISPAMIDQRIDTDFTLL